MTANIPPKASSPNAEPHAAVLSSALPEKGIHRIGNLVYTTRGLIALFAWLLWFDFCFTLMESVLGPIIQLRLLNELGMDANSYKFVLSTIPAVLNFILNPIVSIKSDRYRSRFGRRIPFLLIGAPPVCACLALIGFGNEIAAWLQNSLFQGATLVTVTIWTFSILMLLFTIFNMLLGTTFYYLFNDVVPQQHFVKFMGYFRAAGTVAGMVYSYWIFPYSNKSGPLDIDLGFWSYHAENFWYPKLILLGAAGFYVFASTIALIKVKEPDYPPPDPLGEGTGIVQKTTSTIATITRECFSHRFYVLYFITMIVLWLSYQMGDFMNPARVAMGMDLKVLGRFGAYTGFITLALTLATATWGDRWRPLPLMLAAMAMMILKAPIQLLFLIPGLSSDTYLWIQISFNVVGIPIGVIAAMAEAPLAMSLMPQARFGQFGAAQSMLRAVLAQIIGGQLAGLLMSYLQHTYGNYALRYAFVWSFVFQIAALFCFWILYKEWQKLGGRKSFQPPAVRPVGIEA